MPIIPAILDRFFYPRNRRYNLLLRGHEINARADTVNGLSQLQVTLEQYAAMADRG